jgi:hypothetical protein
MSAQTFNQRRLNNLDGRIQERKDTPTIMKISKKCYVSLLNCLLLQFVVLAWGCSNDINLSSRSKPALIFNDEIEFTNESEFGLGDVEVTLKLKYPNKTEKLSYTWHKWKIGEVKTVEVPQGLKTLQTYTLSGQAAQSIDVRGAFHGPQNISRTWYNH